MLSGLAQSDRRADLDAKIAEWLAQEKNLVEMAHYVQLTPTFDPALLAKLLVLGIKRKEDPVLVQVMSSFGRRYADAPAGLIESIFLPAIEYFTERRDARWINLVWFLPQERSPLPALAAHQMDVVLRNLVHLHRIESHAERVLGLLGKTQPEKVFDFFGERLKYAASREDDGERYEEVPFQFHGLQKRFADIADHAVNTVRPWFVSGDAMFQYRGGRLLASSFPDFPEALRLKLLPYVGTGNREDIEFVIRVMSGYHGEAFLNDTCKAVVRALPAGDPLLPNVENILQSTGVLEGEFGFVACTKKKQEMAGWLNDPDTHVRTFAESYVHLLDRRIASEQRRAEESLEMRKRTYDDPDDGGETQS
jgi:hypothetical protein